MNQLITLNQNTINNEEIQTVNARELYQFLESKQDFSTWMKNRITQYGFVENQDFIRLHKKMEANNATIIEYHISLDMAKELSMVERNDKGRQARKYFIECEKQLKEVVQPQFKLPQTYLEALEELVVVIKEKEVLLLENQSQKQQLLEQVPKVDFANKVATSENALDFKTVAKFFGTGRNKLFKLCRDEGYLMQDNLPYQKYTENNWFTTVEIVITRQDRTFTKSKTLITGTGQLELQKRHFSHIPVQVIYDENMRIALEEESDE